MASTNVTTNYSLSQFIGTDKPAWLTDYNGDMLKIDTQMKANADAAANAQADATALNTQINDPSTGLAAALNTLDAQINTPGTGLAADTAANALAISGVSAKVGTGTLQTTAQNCIDAINEVNTGKANAGNLLKYTGAHNVEVTGDGVKTISTLLNELYTALTTYLSAKGSNYRFEFTSLAVGAPISRTMYTFDRALHDKNFNTFVGGYLFEISASVLKFFTFFVSNGNSSAMSNSNGTYSDDGATVLNTGYKITVTFKEYELI